MALKDWTASETVEGADMQALTGYLPDVILYGMLPRDVEIRGGQLPDPLAFERILSLDIECLMGQTLGVLFEAKDTASVVGFDLRIVAPSGRAVATMQTGTLPGSYQTFGGFWDLRAYSTGNCRVDMRGGRAAVEVWANNSLGDDTNFGYIRYFRVWGAQSTTISEVGEPTPTNALTPDVPPP